MPTSGNVVYTATRSGIIHDAAVMVGHIAENETLSPAVEQSYVRALQGLIKQWQAMGIHVWKVKNATLFLQAGQTRYELGPGSTDHATESYVETELSEDKIAGSVVIVLADATGIAVDDNIGILLNDGTIHWTTVTVAAAPNITIAAALPDGALEGTAVYAYTSKISRPLKVVHARRYDTITRLDTPLTKPMARTDYLELPNKEQQGPLNQVFYDAQIPRGVFNVWMAPIGVTELCKFTWHQSIENLDAASDEADFPAEWILALTTNLAAQKALGRGLPQNQYRQILDAAARNLSAVMGFDQEAGSVYFQPDDSR